MRGQNVFGAILLNLLVYLTEAFVPHPSSHGHGAPRSSFTALEISSGQSVIVVSPPGGVGEVAAVKTACLGCSVRWFVVSKEQGSSVTLAPQALQEISDASGSLVLAGASVEDLKAGGEAVAAVSTWCSSANGIVCTYDGADADNELKAAIQVASKEAGKGVSGPRVAILGADEDLDDAYEVQSDDGVARLVGSIFGGGQKGPATLARALGGNPSIVRHGELFGIPESSSEFSPLVGGPRRDPVITEEYTMRTVRVDPFLVSGNVMTSSSRKSCRHAVGEAAALLATGCLKTLSEDVSISSQPGTGVWTLDQWEDEFDRVRELVASGKASTLFSQEMIVDDTERLAEWLATKWAPAVMRTYDIAAIRIGARPVSSSRVEGSKVEIVWQELVNFETICVGKMLLEVSEYGITASREGGDAAKGYGSTSKKPLPGEDVLVRRLADAASQSIEKGLAKKVPSKKQAKSGTALAAPVSSLQSAGSVDPSPTPKTAGTGPRQSGARRSTPRTRRGTSEKSS
mmetsp:Transcript_16378/g.46848  ORF Transcript_16378/g.46848 Transcript_16378/m.46848 type:complete len:516 (-) Transcript_16378:1020-2567(-)